MDETSWLENEVAQAYDEKFQILEAARKQYGQGVRSLLEGIRTKLTTKHPADRVGNVVVVETTLQDNGDFGKIALVCELKTGDDISRVQVIARVSAPWGGKAGLLQLGVATTLDPRQIGSNVEDLREKAIDWNDEEGVSGVEGVGISMPNWIHEETRPLHDANLVDGAADRITSLLALASDIALEIGDEYALTKRIVEALEAARNALDDMVQNSGFSACRKAEWWKGMRYAQIDRKGSPSFWVGYHVEKRCVMYGHNRSPECSELQPTIHRALDARSPSEYGGWPAGTLLEETELRVISEGDLVQRIVAAFGAFLITLDKCLAGRAAAQTNVTVADQQ